MKFMLFAATALAATVTRQSSGLQTVEDALAAISSGTSSLRDGINAFSGIADAGALEDQASGLVSTINSQNSIIAGIDPLDSSAATLATPLQDLAALVSGTVDDLVAKKQTFIDAGVAGVVEDAATQLQAASNTLITTTLGKVPSNLQGLGQTLSQPIIDALNRAVNEFQGLENGGGATTTGGSGATTTGGSSTPTSATTSGSGSGSYTTTAATTSGSKPSSTTSAGVGSYTGAAIANAANGFGAVAMAVLAGAAML